MRADLGVLSRRCDRVHDQTGQALEMLGTDKVASSAALASAALPSDGSLGPYDPMVLDRSSRVRAWTARGLGLGRVGLTQRGLVRFVESQGLGQQRCPAIAYTFRMEYCHEDGAGRSGAGC